MDITGSDGGNFGGRPSQEMTKRPNELALNNTTSSSTSFDTNPSLDVHRLPPRFVSLWVPADTETKSKITDKSPTSSTTSRPLNRSFERSPGKKSAPVVLLNHLDGSEVTDTLHSHAIQVSFLYSSRTVAHFPP